MGVCAPLPGGGRAVGYRAHARAAGPCCDGLQKAAGHQRAGRRCGAGAPVFAVQRLERRKAGEPCAPAGAVRAAHAGPGVQGREGQGEAGFQHAVSAAGLPHHHAQPEGIFHHQYGGGALMEGQRRILDLCVDAGETLLANGAEIYRVQQTMEIIARSYGARSFHVYVLTNGLFASMEDGGAVQSAAVRSTPRVEMNLGRISAVNALSREIVAGRVPLEEAFARLAQIRATRGLPDWLMVSASAFSAACFCYLFGGSAVDAFTALAPGFAVGLFTRALARVRTPLNKLVSNMLSAGVVALVSLACVQALGLAGVACSLDKVIIGGIIPLVPGVALTNGIRDVANCDYLSGTIRAIDAVLIAAGIALGVGLVLKGAALLPGVTI
ncbi:threonine/serine exporter [Subdoligranulum sp. OF01-18]|nr:threonine/serine exporter [Subdoligranulum sp. OF01-18]